MAYSIFFDDKVQKDLRGIDKAWQKKIIDAIKTKLAEDPYMGRKLIGDLSDYRRLRVGDYRVIYEVIEEEVIIVVIKIAHRKEVYRN